MRIKCSFDCDQLPVAYHMLFVSLIKNCLQESNEEYFRNIYFFGERQNKRSKNFTFSVFLRDYELVDDLFEIRGGVDLFVSSPDPEWMVHFYNGIIRKSYFRYRDFQLIKKRTTLLKEKKIDQPYALFETLSPVLVKDRNNNSIPPDDPKFNQELNYIADINLKNYRGEGLQTPLRFTPVDMKKVVVKEAIQQYQENTEKPYLYIEGYKGRFLLEGNPGDLNCLYQLGIGFRRSSGWGMIEVVHS